MKTYIKLLFVMAALLTLTNCDKKENKNTTYRWDGINCLSNDNGQVVAANLCGQVGSFNTEYYLNNMGQCISRYTGQIAPSNLYCSNTGGGYQQCYGSFQYPYNGQLLQLTCQGQYGYLLYNGQQMQVQCSGATVITAGGQTVICQ